MKNTLRITAIVITAMTFAASYFSISNAAPEGISTAAPEVAPAVPPFSHTSSAHKKLTCNECHSVPGRNWQKFSKFPDVGTFPYHTACERCHIQSTNPYNPHKSPAVMVGYCGGCHTRPPTAPLRSFPVAGRKQQFTTIFPHNVHQDLIAKGPSWRGGTAVAHFVNASYVPIADDKAPDFYNCSACHKSYASDAKLKFSFRTPIGEVKAAFETLQSEVYEKDEKGNEKLPNAAYFKDSPNSHASCFNCHFQGPKPNANDCAGCHRSAAPYTETAGITRFSIKFDHKDPNHVIVDCTSCHIRITRTAELKDMVGADVPIVSCFRCHATQEDQRPKRIVQAEIEDREKSIKDKKTPFQCNYCHTGAIGRYEIPASHKP